MFERVGQIMPNKNIPIPPALNDPHLRGRHNRIKRLRLLIKNGRPLGKTKHLKNPRPQLPTKYQKSPQHLYLPSWSYLPVHGFYFSDGCIYGLAVSGLYSLPGWEC